MNELALGKAYWNWPDEPDNDSDRLRAIADYLDGLDDAMGNTIRTLQETLRRIADEMSPYPRGHRRASDPLPYEEE